MIRADIFHDRSPRRFAGFSSVAAATLAVIFTVCASTTAHAQSVNLQATSPGSQQMGNMNISGTGIFRTRIGVGTSTPAGPFDFTVPYAKTDTTSTHDIGFFGKSNEASGYAGMDMAWGGGAT